MPKGEGFWLPPDMYRQIYLCLWEMPDGRYIGDTDGSFLCAESYQINDPIVEKKMRQAVEVLGVEPGGKPIWMPGRKVTDMEADDQMERLLDGKIPDEREETLIALEDALNEDNGVS